jgi:hypothetical protein
MDKRTPFVRHLCWNRRPAPGNDLRSDLKVQQQMTERKLSGAQLVKNHREAVYVRVNCVGLPLKNLRSHPSRRSGSFVAVGRRKRWVVGLDPRQPEVANDNIAPLIEQDIGALQVAMDNGTRWFMKEGKSFSDSDRNRNGIDWPHRSLVESVGEAAALIVLHHDARSAAA